MPLSIDLPLDDIVKMKKKQERGIKNDRKGNKKIKGNNISTPKKNIIKLKDQEVLSCEAHGDFWKGNLEKDFGDKIWIFDS